jgi:hypothetical protein
MFVQGRTHSSVQAEQSSAAISAVSESWRLLFLLDSVWQKIHMILFRPMEYIR